jgi:predicted TIM-barrel fold metal-dependent hydrolase
LVAFAYLIKVQASETRWWKLAPLGLSFDGLHYHPQIEAFTELARAFPDTSFQVPAI